MATRRTRSVPRHAGHRYACEVVWRQPGLGEQATLLLLTAPSHRAASERIARRFAGRHPVALRCWRPDEPPAERIELLWQLEPGAGLQNRQLQSI